MIFPLPWLTISLHLIFLKSISSNTDGIQSYFDHAIIFKDVILYPIYNILDISWLGIYNKNTIIYLHDAFGVSSQMTTYTIVACIKLIDS